MLRNALTAMRHSRESGNPAMPSRNSGFPLALRLAGMTMRKVIVIAAKGKSRFLLSWGSFDLALDVKSASQKLER